MRSSRPPGSTRGTHGTQGTRWRLLACALVAAAGLVLAWPELPDPLFATPASAIAVARDGTLLGGRIASDGQWRFPASSGSAQDAVPDKYRVAITRFEDRRFERHPGVDPIALARAFVQNWTAGRVVSGGSTLTMQVVRLMRPDRPRSYREKATEIALALRLEARLDKREILALHAANAPFGGNVVGLEAASWRYFRHAPESLSWAEAATLAVLPNRPGLVHPGRGREQLQRRRDALLRSLHEAGELDPLELRLALAEPLAAQAARLPRRAPHLLDTLTARHGPRRFETTLDAALQRRTTEVVERHAAQLSAQGIHNAAVLVIDNASSEVRSYVGNAPGRLVDGDTAAGRGRAIDLLQRPRSTGSVLKPFLFALMLEAGEILPDMLVPDVPTRFGGFAPENADRRHRGAVPASLALARSLNVPAVRMLADHGVARFHAELEQLGLTTLHRAPSGYGLTLVLGGAEATPFELAGLYSNLARIATAGPDQVPRQRRPRLLRARSTGPPEAPARYGPGAAWLTLEALTRAARPDTEGDWEAFGDARRIAWKTGTSYGLRDAWAIGTTPETTVAVWVGNASGEGVAGLSGVGSAAPLLFEVFRSLEVSDAFPIPRHDLRTVRVCADDGYLESGGCETRAQLAPRHGHFARPSPHHRLVHLDAAGSHRVDSRCARVGSMRTQSWLVLPPDQEHWYRQHAAHYRPLPPLHPDCAGPDVTPIALVYPAEGAGIYVPVELHGERGRAVFRAIHRDPDAVVHWHLDDRYLGSTETFHDLEIDALPGPHRLTLVDARGHRLERRFELLGDGRRGG